MIHFSSEELASKFYFTQAPAIASPGSKVSGKWKPLVRSPAMHPHRGSKVSFHTYF